MPCGVSRPNGSFSILAAGSEAALAPAGTGDVCAHPIAPDSISRTSAEKTVRVANLNVKIFRVSSCQVG